jgi:2-oxoglutarate/2-oxoacid ferredoxin oxidoreductase subunit beta
VKLANPELTVVIMGGDGDGYGIGMGHFIHACRRNLDMVYLVFDNENYALTTGQASPTTPVGVVTKTTPNGNTTLPFSPLKLAEDAGCGFAKM